MKQFNVQTWLAWCEGVLSTLRMTRDALRSIGNEQMAEQYDERIAMLEREIDSIQHPQPDAVDLMTARVMRNHGMVS